MRPTRSTAFAKGDEKVWRPLYDILITRKACEAKSQRQNHARRIADAVRHREERSDVAIHPPH